MDTQTAHANSSYMSAPRAGPLKIFTFTAVKYQATEVLQETVIFQQISVIPTKNYFHYVFMRLPKSVAQDKIKVIKLICNTTQSRLIVLLLG